jgi:hypothetical protein
MSFVKNQRRTSPDQTTAEGASLPEEKLAGDLGNVIEATPNRQSSVRFFTAGKLAPSSLGLFQQHQLI